MEKHLFPMRNILIQFRKLKAFSGLSGGKNVCGGKWRTGLTVCDPGCENPAKDFLCVCACVRACVRVCVCVCDLLSST